MTIVEQPPVNLQLPPKERCIAFDHRKRFPVSASTAGSAIGVLGAYNSRQQLWRHKTGIEAIRESPFIQRCMQYGRMAEIDALTQLTRLIKTDIYSPVGTYLVDAPGLNCPATPDGMCVINNESVVIEVKCPYTATPSFMPQQQYYVQTMVQMKAMNACKALLFVWTPDRGQLLHEITFNDEDWRDMEARLRTFVRLVERGREAVTQIPREDGKRLKTVCAMWTPPRLTTRVKYTMNNVKTHVIETKKEM